MLFGMKWSVRQIRIMPKNALLDSISIGFIAALKNTHIFDENAEHETIWDFCVSNLILLGTNDQGSYSPENSTKLKDSNIP